MEPRRSLVRGVGSSTYGLLPRRRDRVSPRGSRRVRQLAVSAAARLRRKARSGASLVLRSRRAESSRGNGVPLRDHVRREGERTREAYGNGTPIGRSSWARFGEIASSPPIGESSRGRSSPSDVVRRSSSGSNGSPRRRAACPHRGSSTSNQCCRGATDLGFVAMTRRCPACSETRNASVRRARRRPGPTSRSTPTAPRRRRSGESPRSRRSPRPTRHRRTRASEPTPRCRRRVGARGDATRGGSSVRQHS